MDLHHLMTCQSLCTVADHNKRRISSLKAVVIDEKSKEGILIENQVANIEITVLFILPVTLVSFDFSSLSKSLMTLFWPPQMIPSLL